MRTPAGAECRYYYEDFHRRAVQECRLVARNPASRTWSPDLCGACAVPQILSANACPHLLLKAAVETRFIIRRQVKVEAYCDYQKEAVAEPRIGCGACAIAPR